MTNAEKVLATVSTAMSVDRLSKFATPHCHSEFHISLIARDPLQIPQLYICDLEFGTIEDRDKVMIALRMLEKEKALVQQRAAAATKARSATH